MDSSSICVEAAPQQERIGLADQELAAPPQVQLMEEATHKAAAGIDSTCSHKSVPTSSDQLYSKLLCWNCGIGEVLGEVVCGEKFMLFCCEGQEDCGLGGKDGCIKCLGSCEGFMPAGRCGCFCKFFPIKCGLVNPLEKPFLVVNKKTIA
uniref:Uncharacterized protein n=1 Tax=Prorocentrum micans TaxID=2945 RepID=A0A7S2TDM0_PROMC